MKFSIERTIAAKNVGSVRAELNEVESITVDSPTKLTIKLKTPIAGQFYNLLANGETFVVSPTAVNSGTPLDEKPVGAGPFMLDSYTPESKAVFKKNPNYFEKDKIKLAGVELIQTTQAGIDPQAPINSLLDGITNAAQMGGLTGTEALDERRHQGRREAERHHGDLRRAVQEQAAVRQPEGASGDQLRRRPRPDQPAPLPGHQPADVGPLDQGERVLQPEARRLLRRTTRRRPRSC